ncbi:hypothetical protein LZZ85_16945 [Terrimonas sp. NA20]|uniref:Uncharacterized protein n=1 Tax=Terrimonas ginsenosidimutans TaxID=2908004 RepID=A0ABS9KUG6_9BACT|nr:hypothetical protein [Terrimonas ginsenosidimutans]MCG2615987.1 hypothetical protein [Terrimonas ginsenosidimutans]
MELQLDKKAVKEAPDNMSRGLWASFSWWDSAKIVTLIPFYKKGEHENHTYLWIDSTKGKVYFMEYDL